MIKPKVVKIILEELDIGNGKPFIIEGERTPYRVKKDGNIERFIGQVWLDSCYSYLDLIALGDSNRITHYDGVIVEDLPTSKSKKRK